MVPSRRKKKKFLILRLPYPNPRDLIYDMTRWDPWSVIGDRSSDFLLVNGRHLKSTRSKGWKDSVWVTVLGFPTVGLLSFVSRRDAILCPKRKEHLCEEIPLQYILSFYELLV